MPGWWFLDVARSHGAHVVCTCGPVQVCVTTSRGSGLRPAYRRWYGATLLARVGEHVLTRMELSRRQDCRRSGRPGKQRHAWRQGDAGDQGLPAAYWVSTAPACAQVALSEEFGGLWGGREVILLMWRSLASSQNHKNENLLDVWKVKVNNY